MDVECRLRHRRSGQARGLPSDRRRTTSGAGGAEQSRSGRLFGPGTGRWRSRGPAASIFPRCVGVPVRADDRFACRGRARGRAGRRVVGRAADAGPGCFGTLRCRPMSGCACWTPSACSAPRSAVAAVRQGKTAAQVRALLRRMSGVDAVVDQVSAVGAEVRYRRVLDAVAELEALAVCRRSRIGGFLCPRRHGDRPDGRRRGPGRGRRTGRRRAATMPAGHLPRAVRWQRYSRGPVSDLHRACGADIARGSLRLWSRAGAEAGEAR